MTWFTEYRHDIEKRGAEWMVSIWQKGKLIQELPFQTCGEALSFVERREGCQKFSSFH